MFPTISLHVLLSHITHSHQTHQWLALTPAPGVSLLPPPDDRHALSIRTVFYNTLWCQEPCPAQWHIHQFPPQEFWIRPDKAIIIQTNAALKNFMLAKSCREGRLFTIHTKQYIHPPRILWSSLYLWSRREGESHMNSKVWQLQRNPQILRSGSCWVCLLSSVLTHSLN